MKIEASPVYLDASALIKLYVPEVESNELEDALIGRTDIIVSELAVTEVASALARRLRQGELEPSVAKRVYRRLLLDRDREFRRVEVTAEVHREAERLLFTIGSSVPLRSADSLHLALASLAQARAFVAYDRHLRAAVVALGTLELPTR